MRYATCVGWSMLADCIDDKPSAFTQIYTPALITIPRTTHASKMSSNNPICEACDVSFKYTTVVAL